MMVSLNAIVRVTGSGAVSAINEYSGADALHLLTLSWRSPLCLYLWGASQCYHLQSFLQRLVYV